MEIKSISRQPGERTKIAVCSKNEKVDSVGAGVGMRGNRVRNIVNELQGEKIDIVRYNEDIKEYIKAALSPAKVAEIKIDKENMKAEVIVDDDQLSLAIGRHGQNVKLASRLIGWGLDIRTKTMAAEQAGKKAEVADTESLPQEEPLSLEQLSGVGKKTAENLLDAGIKTVADILSTGLEALTEIKGIGQKKAQKLIAEAKKIKS